MIVDDNATELTCLLELNITCQASRNTQSAVSDMNNVVLRNKDSAFKSQFEHANAVWLRLIS
jgi:hypothetical protein